MGLSIYYDKQETKNKIDKVYIDNLINGCGLLGSSDSISDMSVFKDIKTVYTYDNVKGYVLLDLSSGNDGSNDSNNNNKDNNNSINEYSGFWVYKE